MRYVITEKDSPDAPVTNLRESFMESIARFSVYDLSLTFTDGIEAKIPVFDKDVIPGLLNDKLQMTELGDFMEEVEKVGATLRINHLNT